MFNRAASPTFIKRCDEVQALARRLLSRSSKCLKALNVRLNKLWLPGSLLKRSRYT